METVVSELSLVVKSGEQSELLDLPNRIFKPLAEQFRWDSLRKGDIDLEDWPKVLAYAKPQLQDKSKPSKVVINLICESGKRVSTCYDVSTWQGLALAAQQTLSDSESEKPQHPVKLELQWNNHASELGVSIPLSPLNLPMENVEQRSHNCAHLKPLKLIVSEKVMSSLDELSKESSKLGLELGGCLIGRMPDMDKLLIKQVAYATESQASSWQFSFNPRFWLEINSRLAGKDLRVLGWYHSHLCDEGFPVTLSNRDIQVFHRHFTAPWSISALVCASHEKAELKWFGWRKGSVVELIVNSN